MNNRIQCILENIFIKYNVVLDVWKKENEKTTQVISSLLIRCWNKSGSITLHDIASKIPTLGKQIKLEIDNIEMIDSDVKLIQQLLSIEHELHHIYKLYKKFNNIMIRILSDDMYGLSYHLINEIIGTSDNRFYILCEIILNKKGQNEIFYYIDLFSKLITNTKPEYQTQSINNRLTFLLNIMNDLLLKGDSHNNLDNADKTSIIIFKILPLFEIYKDHYSHAFVVLKPIVNMLNMQHFHQAIRHHYIPDSTFLYKQTEEQLHRLKTIILN